MRELSKKKSFGKRDLLDVDEHLSVYIVAYHCMKFFAYSPECKRYRRTYHNSRQEKNTIVA